MSQNVQVNFELKYPTEMVAALILESRTFVGRLSKNRTFAEKCGTFSRRYIVEI